MATPQRGKHRRVKRVLSLAGLFCGAWHPSSLPKFGTFGCSFLGTSQCQVLAVSHTGRQPKNWLSCIPSVQFAVQAAETSEVVAFFADAFTSVCVLAQPASSGDNTTAEGFTVYLLSLSVCSVRSLQWCSMVVKDSAFAKFCRHPRGDPACFVLVFFKTHDGHRQVFW